MKYVVEMIVDGKPVRKISYQGKTYLPVTLGKTFVIRVKNNSNRRCLAVVSVDGVNVLDASDASHDGPGYVVSEWGSVDIDGWRQNMQSVAQFEITGQEGSYASKTGRPSNVGVVGVAIFEEYFAPTGPKGYTPQQRRVWPKARSPYLKGGFTGQSSGGGWMGSCEHEEPTSGGIELPNEGTVTCRTHSDPTKTCSLSNSSPIKAGTGYGDSVQSEVTEVYFAKKRDSKQVVVLYYDTVEALRAKGVPVDYDSPNPFPAEPERFFCPPPPK